MSSIKLAYGSTVALTIDLSTGPLASDSALLAGRQSTIIDNSSNLYVDFLLAGKITTGTSPTTAKQIEVWVYGAESDGGGSPVYPDVITGSDANKTFTSADIKYSSLALAALLNTDATTARTYWFRPVSIASLFGGAPPSRWGAFVVHNTAVALNSTGGNHALYSTPVYATVV